jgi:hypothetical protein
MYHATIQRYSEKLIHYHLSPHHITIGRFYAISPSMLFHVFSYQRDKRKTSLSEVGLDEVGGGLHNAYAIPSTHLLPMTW